MIDRRSASCHLANTLVMGEHGYTHGKSVSIASVMPKPARRTGVSATLGLIAEPTKGPMGVCYDVVRTKNTRDATRTALTPL